MTQNEQVLSLLKRGRCLSALDGWKLGIGRLAARIAELRGQGLPIETRMVSVRTRHGKARIAVYRMTHG